jgi:probable F420-dependent oxidoreductase
MTDLGPWGIAVSNADLAAVPALEDLGFTTMWLAGGQLDRLSRLDDLLTASRNAVVASAIIPADVYPPSAVTELYRRTEANFPGRLLVGLGGPQHTPTMAAAEAYLDQLDEVPPHRRVLAAMGPRKLDLARRRAAGAIPILVTPEYTAYARSTLGPDRLLAVGLFVVLDDDPRTARRVAQEPLQFLLGRVPAYRESARRQGFTDHDVATLSDRLVDTLTVWGSPDTVAGRALALQAAGADHVNLTVLPAGNRSDLLWAADRLAAALSR